MPYAVPADITSRWVGDGVPTDEGQLAVLIGDAGTLIRRAFPDIDERINEPISEGGVTGDDVKLVVVGMVTRLLRNPAGIRTKQDALGQWSESTTFSGDSPGTLSFTNEDRAILGGSLAGGTAAFSIDLTPAAGRGWLGAGGDCTVINGPACW